MDQSNKEEFWNSLTHFTGIILTLIGVPFLITQNSDLTKLELFSLLFFQFGLLFMYTSSTLYHYVQNIRIKKVLRVVDHISIYYLIAGSYAPVCLITLRDHSGTEIFLIVISLMLLGTLFKIFFTGKFEKFSLYLYLLMGWLISYCQWAFIYHRNLFLFFKNNKILSFNLAFVCAWRQCNSLFFRFVLCYSIIAFKKRTMFVLSVYELQ